MEAVLRASAIFLIVFVLFRVFGKRTLSEITTFDLVLLLIISEATQQALLGEDFSLTQAVLAIATLIVLERAWDFLAYRYPWFRGVAESRPLVIMRDGHLDRGAMRAAQVSEDDILHSARAGQGLERLDQIKHVVLEISGGLSVIPEVVPPGGGWRQPRPRRLLLRRDSGRATVPPRRRAGVRVVRRPRGGG